MLGSNEGLRSRVTGRIPFPDWDADDCVEAVRQKCEREAIRLTDAAAQLLADELREIQSRPSWANARDSVTTCRLLYKARAQRCAGAAEAEPSYVEQDVTKAMAMLRETRPQGDPISAAAAAEAAIKFAQAAAASAARPSPQLGNFVGGAIPASAAPPVECRECEAENEWEVVDVTDQAEVQQAAPPEPDIDPVYAALLKACVAEGYDKSHESRKELVTILEAVEVPPPLPDPLSPCQRALSRIRHVAGWGGVPGQHHEPGGGGDGADGSEGARDAQAAGAPRARRDARGGAAGGGAAGGGAAAGGGGTARGAPPQAGGAPPRAGGAAALRCLPDGLLVVPVRQRLAVHGRFALQVERITRAGRVS